MPVIAVLGKPVRENVLAKFFFLELADSLSVALADVHNHTLSVPQFNCLSLSYSTKVQPVRTGDTRGTRRRD